MAASTGSSARSQSLRTGSLQLRRIGGAPVSACGGDTGAEPEGCSVAPGTHRPVASIITAVGRARGMSRGRPGVPVCCGAALALDAGQAFGELAISDPDDIHATHVPVRPVVAPAHDGAS
jgi:hypothetical protein